MPVPVPVPSTGAVLRSAAFAVVFCAAVLLGRMTVMDGTSLSLVWPAAGVAVVWFAAQRRAGTRWLDVVLVSAATFVLNAVTGASPALAACFVGANLAQVATFGALFARWCPDAWGAGGREPLTGVAQLMRLLAAAVLATGAGALLGPTSVWALTGHWSWLTALVWMTRNTASILLVAATAFRVGCLLSARRDASREASADTGRPAGPAVLAPVRWPRGGRLVELALALACSVLAYALVFGVYHRLPVAFPLIALSAWVALRFDTTIVLVHDLLMGVVAVLLTLAGDGPFAMIADDATRAVVVQLYVVVLAVLGLALAMGRDERDLLLAAMVASTAASERSAREAAALRVVAEEQRALAERARREAVEAAAEAELRGELTRAVLDSVDVGIVVADGDGRLTLFNRAAQAWHGLDADAGLEPDEHAGRYDLFAADGTTALAAHDVPLAQVMRTGAVTGAEMVIAPTGREALTVLCSGRRMSRADGTPLGAVVAMTDVSADRALRRDLESARAQAREQADLLGAAFEASMVGNVHLDLTGTALRVNAAAAAMLGHDPADLVGRSWGQLVHPEDRSARREAMREFLAGPRGTGSGGTTALGGQVRHLHRDGHVVHTQVSSALVTDGRGRPVHLASQIVDVSARVAAEEAVRGQRDVSTRLLRALSDLGEGVLVEHEDQITYANDALARLTGRRTPALLALPTSLLLVPEAEQEAWSARRAFAPGQLGAGASTVTALRHADGTSVPVEVTTVPLPDAGGRATLTLVRDLSERLRDQAALAASNDRLREANRLKDDLVATLSHDLRQPLSTTTGFAELLLDEWDEIGEDEKRQHLGRIHRAGRWADDLLEDILTMAQLEAGTPVPRTARVHLPALVADVVDRLHVQASLVDTTGVQDLTVLADRGHLQQVLTNLVANAFTYGAPPVRLTARRRGDQVALDVVDAGEGVPEEFVPRLFTRFARATTGVAADRKGTGLGLYIARQLANANGGDLTHQPAAGGGSRFTLTLDAVDAVDAGAREALERAVGLA
ncbi:PAS domain S-box protein [Kineococcus rhizosphaerae]|uniref:histidine kinase n=1 Tax=Kineococcus rhizosphaerae TaxID=559628 RepID=A0A2T0R4A0_9ACTN|nr:PAS domain S-box protein [Kineococcus rhizosphaerae]PRY15183.1 PAS domain S-box-containing protein [Kineococcus rhizosphaerae]